MQKISELLKKTSKYYEIYHEYSGLEQKDETHLQMISGLNQKRKTVAYSRFQEIKLPKKRLVTNNKFKSINKNYLNHLLRPINLEKTAVELYLLLFNTNLQQGLYHYFQPNHSLEKLPYKNTAESFTISKYMFNNWEKKPELILIQASNLKKYTSIHDERGYRYALIDTGRVTEQVLCTAKKMKIKAQEARYFYDKAWNELLDFIPFHLTVTNIVAIFNHK